MKYDEAFIKKVKEHWYANKGKELYTTKSKDVHKSSYTYKKKYGLTNLADDFDLTYAQVSRIVYHK
mgnify:FL=1|tara:strand:+ start:910 stop:1107 length:198 start_codon:yes stop_codon:yes gene_type:complete